jgi:hypothetical protein
MKVKAFLVLPRAVLKEAAKMKLAAKGWVKFAEDVLKDTLVGRRSQ